MSIHRYHGHLAARRSSRFPQEPIRLAIEETLRQLHNSLQSPIEFG